ncbi:MAG: Abi family protein [Synergistes sp.]|nr:Abi family protein [Synergistes sp.]
MNKKWLSFEEQAQKLIDRKLCVENKQDLIDFLKKKNYYYISGYLFGFRIANGEEYEDKSEKDGILQFKKIKSIMQLDELLRVIFTYPIEIIERDFKTKLAYYSSQPEDCNNQNLRETQPLWYTDKNNFQNPDAFSRFDAILKKEKSSKKSLPFVKHYKEKYNDRMPIWVAVEILTFGTILTLFKNMPVKKRRKISNDYGCSLYQLESWIPAIIDFRNLLAHDYRLYQHKVIKTPKQKDGCVMSTHKIFDYLLVCRHLIRDKALWNGFVIGNINKFMNKYNKISFNEGYGFPDNWQNYLIV